MAGHDAGGATNAGHNLVFEPSPLLGLAREVSVEGRDRGM